MKSLKCLLMLILLSLSGFAAGQDTRKAELKLADQKLNEIYQQILVRLAKGEQAKLKKSQYIWITFRDLDCKWAFGAQPLDCMIDRTENRARELQDTVFFDKNGNYQMVKN